MPKGQVKILVSYCLCMLVLTQLLQHSHKYQSLLEPLAALFGSFLPIAISVFAIKNGWAIGRIRVLDRDESPLTYWLLVILGFGIGAYLLYQGVRGVASLV